MGAIEIIITIKRRVPCLYEFEYADFCDKDVLAMRINNLDVRYNEERKQKEKKI